MSQTVGESRSGCWLGSCLSVGVRQKSSYIRNEKNPSLTLWGLGFALVLPELVLHVSWRKLCPLGHFWVTPICAIYQDRLFLFSVPSSLQVFPSTAVSSPVEESEAGFTGRRLNSKMQVYSGSKTAYLPKMMSLYQQCIRVLSNNIDCKYLSLSQTHCARALKFWQLVATDPSSSPLLQTWEKSHWKSRSCRISTQNAFKQC